MTTKELTRKRTVLRTKIKELERMLVNLTRLGCVYTAEVTRQQLVQARHEEQETSWEIYDREYPTRS